MNIQAVSSPGSVALPSLASPGAVPQSAASPLPASVVQALPGEPDKSSQAQPAPERAHVEEAVVKVRQKIQAISNTSLDFSIDDSTGKTIVRVTDKASGDLIRQIPAQEILEIAQSLDHLQGMLVRQKA